MLTFPFVFIIAPGGGPIVFFVMFAQYPVYGLILGEAKRRGRFDRALVVLGTVHATAIVLLATGAIGPVT